MKYFKYILQFLLLPFGLLYGIIMEIRKAFYKTGIFKSEKFSVPVISVGNITAGGSGKTPFTIFLAEELKEYYKNIAVVSRGYRRKSKGLQLVSDGQNILLGPDDAGDEPYLIAKKLPGLICAVSEKRKEAVSFLINKFQVDLILLDDAFQHFGVQRDLDILLINCRQPFKFNLPIPAGSLREFKYNYKRAQIIIFTNSKSARIPVLKTILPAFRSCGELDKLVNLDFETVGTIIDLKGKKVTAFAGIAKPDNFKKSLGDSGLDVSQFFSFPDHYNFSAEDIKMMISKAAVLNCRFILCTEKDLVKIQAIENVDNVLKDSGCRLLGVSWKPIITNQKEFINNIKTILT